MSFEYLPWILESIKTDFTQLKTFEYDIEDAKKKKDKNRKQKAESRARSIRKRLAEVAPAEVFYYLKVSHEANADELRATWVNFIHQSGKDISKKNLESWNVKTLYEFFAQPRIEIDCLPSYSFFLRFSFILAKPYISRDDEEFYIIDNPVRKDKVFKIPMVASSSWKGNLRFVMRTIIGGNDNDSRIVRLFGNEKGTEEHENLRMGRLNFYPTFFDSIDLEVINPHDRKTRAGTLPIYIESVPIGAKGIFTLLYVPFDLIRDEEKLKIELTEDLEILNQGIKEMMLTYGFSAKKSSGFGTADYNIDGILQVRNIHLSKPNFHNFDELKENIGEAIRLIREKK